MLAYVFDPLGQGGDGGNKKLTSWWPRSRERMLTLAGFFLFILLFPLGPQHMGWCPPSLLF
jgi:hypothetical protein